MNEDRLKALERMAMDAKKTPVMSFQGEVMTSPEMDVFSREITPAVVLELLAEISDERCGYLQAKAFAESLAQTVLKANTMVYKLRKHLMSYCGLAQGQPDGVYWPEQTSEWCYGFQASQTDDEPCERCKKCPICYHNDRDEDEEE